MSAGRRRCVVSGGARRSCSVGCGARAARARRLRSSRTARSLCARCRRRLLRGERLGSRRPPAFASVGGRAVSRTLRVRGVDRGGRCVVRSAGAAGRAAVALENARPAAPRSPRGRPAMPAPALAVRLAAAGVLLAAGAVVAGGVYLYLFA